MGRHRQFDADAALDAAMAVFWAKGYEGASFEDLCQATGVARPGLYAAFGNKEALFRRALDRYEALHMGFIAEALARPTARAAVAGVLQGSAEVQTRFPEHPGCLGLNGALACSADADAVRRELAARRAASAAALRERLERARAEGELPPESDCAALAAYVMAVSQGMAVQAKAGASRTEIAAIAAQALALWPAPPKG